MRLFHSLGQKTLTSSGKVLMTTFLTTCYQALRLTDSKLDFFTVSVGRR